MKAAALMFILLSIIIGVLSKPTASSNGTTVAELAQRLEVLESENAILEEKVELIALEQVKLEVEGGIDQHRPNHNRALYAGVVEHEYQEMHDITFIFPRQENTQDWVKYILPFPQMKELTMCFWIALEDLQGPFLFSYATSSSNSNHLTVEVQDENTLRVNVDTKYSYFFGGFRFQLQERIHLCISLSLQSKSMTMFENGAFKERKDLSGVSTSYIGGGGALYFGQDQDSFNGGFVSNQALKGEMTNFIMWPRCLSALEVRGVASTCSIPNDYNIRPQITNIQWNGNVMITSDDGCPTTAKEL